MNIGRTASTPESPRPPQPAWLHPAARLRRTGRAMTVIAMLGVVVSTVATVVAWQMIGELNGATRDTLDVTIETIESVEDTIDLADRVLAATADSLGTASETLDAVATSFDAGTGVVDVIDELTTTVGPTLDDAAGTLRQLESVGSSIDGVLGALSSIPFAPDVDVDGELGDSIGAIAAEIEKLPADFEQASADLEGFAVTLDEVEAQIRQLTDDIDDVNAGLDDAGPLITAYRQNITDAKVVAVDTREDLDGSVTLMRTMLVLLGIVFAAGQVAPYWLGRELLDRAAVAEALDRSVPSDAVLP